MLISLLPICQWCWLHNMIHRCTSGTHVSSMSGMAEPVSEERCELGELPGQIICIGISSVMTADFCRHLEQTLALIAWSLSARSAPIKPISFIVNQECARQPRSSHFTDGVGIRPNFITMRALGASGARWSSHRSSPIPSFLASFPLILMITVTPPLEVDR